MKINNSKKGFIIQGVIGVIALALIGGGAYYAGTKKVVVPQADPVVEDIKLIPATENSMAEWKVYRNNEFNFSIQYPTKYKLLTYNTLKSDELGSTVVLQVYDPSNNLIRFGPSLSVMVMKQPYDVSGKIFTNAKDFANFVYKDTQELSIIDVTLDGSSRVEIAGKRLSEVSSELEKFKTVVAINNGLIYQVWYHPIDHKYFAEIAKSFKFTSSTATTIPSIKVLSPGVWKMGQEYVISYSVVGNFGPVTIKLNRYSDDGVFLESFNLGTSDKNNFTYKVPETGLVDTKGAAGRYKIEIYPETARELVERSDYFSIIK